MAFLAIIFVLATSTTTNTANVIGCICS